MAFLLELLLELLLLDELELLLLDELELLLLDELELLLLDELELLLLDELELLLLDELLDELPADAVPAPRVIAMPTALTPAATRVHVLVLGPAMPHLKMIGSPIVIDQTAPACDEGVRHP